MATGPPWEMPRRTNRSRPAASTTVSRSATQAVEGEVLDVPVGESATPFVVADQPVAGGQLPPPVPPHRALPVVVEVVEPVGRLDQRSVPSRPWHRRGAHHPGQCTVGPRCCGSVLARSPAVGRRGRSAPARRRRRRSGSRGRATSGSMRCVAPSSPIARRAALMRLVSADSLTKRSPHTSSSSSSLETTRSRWRSRWTSTSKTCGSTATASAVATQLAPLGIELAAVEGERAHSRSLHLHGDRARHGVRGRSSAEHF